MSLFDTQLISAGLSPILERRDLLISLQESTAQEKEDSLKEDLHKQLSCEVYCNSENKEKLLKWLDDMIVKLGPLDSTALLSKLSKTSNTRKIQSRSNKHNIAKQAFLDKFKIGDYKVYDCLSYVLSNNPFHPRFKDSLEIVISGSGSCKESKGRHLSEHLLSKGKLHEYRAKLAHLISSTQNDSVYLADKESALDKVGIDLMVNSHPVQLKTNSQKESKKEIRLEAYQKECLILSGEFKEKDFHNSNQGIFLRFKSRIPKQNTNQTTLVDLARETSKKISKNPDQKELSSDITDHSLLGVLIELKKKGYIQT